MSSAPGGQHSRAGWPRGGQLGSVVLLVLVLLAPAAHAQQGSMPPCCGKFSVTAGSIPLDNIAGDQGLPTSAVAAYNGLPIDAKVQAGQSLSLPCGRIIALVAPQLGGGGGGGGGFGRRKVLGVSSGGGGGSSGPPQVFEITNCVVPSGVIVDAPFPSSQQARQDFRTLNAASDPDITAAFRALVSGVPSPPSQQPAPPTAAAAPPPVLLSPPPVVPLISTPTALPTAAPTMAPTAAPTSSPTALPIAAPTAAATRAPMPAATPPTAAAAPAGKGAHTVTSKPGDTIASIAAANHATEVALLVVNPQVTNTNAPLRPGTVVNLP